MRLIILVVLFLLIPNQILAFFPLAQNAQTSWVSYKATVEGVVQLDRKWVFEASEIGSVCDITDKVYPRIFYLKVGNRWEKKAKFTYTEFEGWFRERENYIWKDFQWHLEHKFCDYSGIAIVPRKLLRVGTAITHHSGWSKLISKNETVEFPISGMPALKNCYYVQCHDAGTDIYYWFKDGIGIVKLWVPRDELIEEYYDYGQGTMPELYEYPVIKIGDWCIKLILECCQEDNAQ